MIFSQDATPKPGWILGESTISGHMTTYLTACVHPVISQNIPKFLGYQHIRLSQNMLSLYPPVKHHVPNMILIWLQLGGIYIFRQTQKNISLWLSPISLSHIIISLLITVISIITTITTITIITIIIRLLSLLLLLILWLILLLYYNIFDNNNMTVINYMYDTWDIIISLIGYYMYDPSIIFPSYPLVINGPAPHPSKLAGELCVSMALGL